MTKRKALKNLKKNIDDGDIIKETNSGYHNYSDESDFDANLKKQIGMTQPYNDVLNQRYALGSPDAKRVFNKIVPPDSVADSAYNGTAHFSPGTKKVNMSFAKDIQNLRGAGTIFFHEHGHYIDYVSAGLTNSDYLSTKNAKFGALLKSDFHSYVKNVMNTNRISQSDAYFLISNEIQGSDKHSISDIIGGLTGNNCMGNYGHKATYWNNPGTVEKEAFAHMYEAMFDSQKRASMKKYFPNALAEFEKMLGGI